jgi:hypothetical protein
MINITYIVSILNSIFQTKLDISCIYFKEFINNLSYSIFMYVYIYNRTRVMGHMSYVVDQIFL